jgi:hypothetical protein
MIRSGVMPRQDNGAHHGIHQRGQVGPLSAGDSALSTEMGFRGVVNSDSNRAYRRSLFSAATLQDSVARARIRTAGGEATAYCNS